MKTMPRTVWALGLVSLFMDVSSELIHALLPVFLVTTLGASTLVVGFVEGIAEATTAITKVFSGVVSDWIGRRKILLVIGYGMAALTKPLFPLASTVELVVAARFIGRVGKGIRGAPRDALVADVTPMEQRGAAFGLRQSLDTIGAFLGPVLAIALMLWFADDIRAVLWFAVVPAVLAVFVLIVAVRDPEHRPLDGPRRFPLARAELRELPAGYWYVVGVGAVLALARFGEGFLVLRAQQVGLPLSWVPAVLIVMSVIYAASAYPAGLLSDRMDRRSLLAIGIAALAGADVVLAALPTTVGALFGTALWGLHMGFSQGLLATLVTDVAPERLRGTAFGVFNLIAGAMILLASVLAGALWESFGAGAAFATGGVLAVVGLIGLLLIRSRAVPEAGP
jgi:MFS family permease